MKKTKKQKLSSLTDTTSMGLTMDNFIVGSTELEISKKVHMKLRRAMYKSTRDVKAFQKYQNVTGFILSTGDYISGNAIFFLKFKNKNGSENTVSYEFKVRGNNVFLNVSGNPTSLISGENHVPVLYTGDNKYGDDPSENSAMRSYKYQNRLLYTILEELLGEYDFKWGGKEKSDIIDGNINVTSYQVAWYSGDLGVNRDIILLFLRAIYGGLDATSNRVVNIGKYIGVNAIVWDNHEGNFSIAHKSGNNRNFSLTLYCKDESPSMEGLSNKDKKRVNKLIRWDCTFNQLLHVLNIRKVCDLEALYKEKCDEDGYDIGFTKFISSEVYRYIKLEYLVGLTREKMIELTELGEEKLSPNLRKLYDYWFNYGKFHDITDKDLAEKLGIPKTKFSESKAKLKKEYGLDVEIPRTTHEAVLDNRSRAQLTEAERGERVLNVNRRYNNSVVTDDEMFERDTKMADKFSNVLRDANNSLRIRKFQPTKITDKTVWILKKSGN